MVWCRVTTAAPHTVRDHARPHPNPGETSCGVAGHLPGPVGDLGADAAWPGVSSNAEGLQVADADGIGAYAGWVAAHGERVDADWGLGLMSA